MPFIGLQASLKTILTPSLDKFEMTLETFAQKSSFLMTIIGDFNAKSCNWYNYNKVRFEGSTIESITSQFGLHQMINETTHLL